MPTPKSKHVVLLSLPVLRERDLEHLPTLRALSEQGETASLTPSFPCVTCSVQATMTTGLPPREHGIVANGLYDRKSGRYTMWTSPNTVIQRPQLWETLAGAPYDVKSAAWFPLQCKQTKAEYACTPAPIHNPDGSESLWCYTHPTELYGELRDRLGHFPLKNYWGPMTSPAASDWIVDSAVIAMEKWRPELFYAYIPHLDYAPQRFGPNSEQAVRALGELDAMLGRLIEGARSAYGEDPTWIVAGEYAITDVSTVVYPNRILRDANLLSIDETDGLENLNPIESKAWAMADHQLAHVFVRENDPQSVERVAALFRGVPGVAEVLTGEERARYAIDHPRCGDVVLISNPDAWFAYYFWDDDAKAPAYARTVDIHRKPGYDPVELFWDREAGGVPLNADLIKGSHGAPARDASQKTLLMTNRPGVLGGRTEASDTDVHEIVMDCFQN
jgi:predicted AlkP superfamily pyrophosphatase or phosphodiesterase